MTKQSGSDFIQQNQNIKPENYSIVLFLLCEPIISFRTYNSGLIYTESAH